MRTKYNRWNLKKKWNKKNYNFKNYFKETKYESKEYKLNLSENKIEWLF
jgi:hypothetical protein